MKGAFTDAHQNKKGLFEAAQRRHAVPRRGRRDAACHAGQAPARASGAADQARRRNRRDRRRRADHRRDEPLLEDMSGEAGSARTSTTVSTSSRSAFRPLRDRDDDIPLLVDHFNRQIAARMGRPPAPILSSDLETLRRYSWPGNVREVENVIERALALGISQVPSCRKIEYVVAARGRERRARGRLQSRCAPRRGGRSALARGARAGQRGSGHGGAASRREPPRASVSAVQAPWRRVLVTAIVSGRQFLSRVQWLPSRHK